MRGKDTFSFIDKSGELEHQSYSKREEETEGIVVGASSSLNIMLYSLDSRDERGRERSLLVCKGEA